MKQLSILIIALTALVTTSCRKVYGDGPMVTETRDVSNFSGADLRCSGEVIYRQGNEYKVVVTAQQNILDILQTYTSNNRLVIRFKDDVRVRSHDPIRVEVTAPSASGFRISGDGSMRSEGLLTSSRMDIDVSGSGNITVSQLKVDYIDANISGSGNITVIEGSANEENTHISGSGNIDLLNVPAANASAETTGSGDTYVNVSQSLDVKITGSGSVFYKGRPVISTRVSGSGKVLPQ
jgi:hypothetical protein